MGLSRYGLTPMAVTQKFLLADSGNSTEGTWEGVGKGCRKVWALDYKALGLNSSSPIY